MTTRGSSYPAESPVRTLVVDDDPDIREGLRAILEREGFPTLGAGDGTGAIKLLDREGVALLLLDLQLPRQSGMQVLEHVARHHPDTAVVVVSGTGSIPSALRAVRLGALDFLEKPVDAARILEAVRRALGHSARELDRLTDRREALARYGMVGRSPAILAIFDDIDRAAGSEAPVLITGESGTGKEMVARAIHRNGGRADGPFVPVNCAAIPVNLMESELFGHVRGAFTGATHRHRGKFEQAHGGILFLDEVGELSPSVQATLLRALEADSIERLGGERPVVIDVRIVAATNRNLWDEMEAGRFREDLFYRLNVIPLILPPLRARPEDIPELVEHFFHLRRGDGGPEPVSSSALSVLLRHDWPGNVRELRNAVDRMLLLSADGPVTGSMAQAAVERRGAVDEVMEGGLRKARERWERDFILRALVAHDWNIQETADALEIHRSHLWKKMRGLAIKPPPA